MCDVTIFPENISMCLLFNFAYLPLKYLGTVRVMIKSARIFIMYKVLNQMLLQMVSLLEVEYFMERKMNQLPVIRIWTSCFFLATIPTFQPFKHFMAWLMTCLFYLKKPLSVNRNFWSRRLFCAWFLGFLTWFDQVIKYCHEGLEKIRNTAE